MKAQRLNNRILIADDERSSRFLLSQFLVKKGYEVFEAQDGEEALALVFEKSPNILLMDLSMPKKDGLEVAKELRTEGNFPLLYIILLTGHTAEEDVKRAMDAGANSFLPKPVELTELMNQIRLGMAELETRRLLMLDSLTHVFNPEQFGKHLCNAEQRVKEGKDEPFSLLALDLDHFKVVNETFGHETGDQVLTAFANLLGEVTRKNDLPCRLREDRFVVLLPETAKEATLMIAGRIQAKTVALELPLGIKLSVSIGAVTYDPEQESSITFAESALAQAKAKGRGLIHHL